MQGYFRILTYGRPYFWMGGLAFASLLVYTLFSAVSLVSVIPFLEILFQQGEPQPPEAGLEGISALKADLFYRLSLWTADTGKSKTLLLFCIWLFVSIILKNAARYFSSYWMAPLEQGVLLGMRNDLFAHLTRLDLSYFSRRRRGDLVSLTVSDVQVVQEAVVGTLQAMIREPITILVFFTALLLISWQLTLFTLLVLPLTGIMISRIAGPLKRAARKGQAVLGELASMVDEFAGGARVVKAFQKETFERDRYARKNREYNKLQVSVARRSELASPLTEIISVAIVCLILYVGGTLILDEKSTLKASEFLGFIAVFSQVLAPVKVLTAAFSKIQRGTAAFSRIEEILNTQPKIQNQPHAVEINGFTREVRFEGVFFSYDSTEVLHNIHFSLPKGATVALVGPSGGGKSTLADLIPRFYDPSQGAIYLDGRDLRDMTVESLRACIGVVSQEGILFHDTVWNNIAYGIPDTDPEAVMEAAKIANAHEFIMELPDQYQTVIGERGSMLSGGQRQRIAIARAVLRNPSILILDEATSNLDTQSEKLVQDALEKLMAQRTSLVIAHRLSTILHADQILVVERGHIVERGTHEELFQKGGRYRELYAVQFES